MRGELPPRGRIHRRALDLGDVARATTDLVRGDALHPLADLVGRREADGLLDGERHVARRREAGAGIAREPAQHDCVDRAVDLRVERARRVDLAFDGAHEDDRLGLAVEEALDP